MISNILTHRSDAVWIPGRKGPADEGCIVCGESARGRYCLVCVRVWMATEVKVRDFERDMRRGVDREYVGQVKRTGANARKERQKTTSRLKMMFRDRADKMGVGDYIVEEGVFRIEIL